MFLLKFIYDTYLGWLLYQRTLVVGVKVINRFSREIDFKCQISNNTLEYQFVTLIGVMLLDRQNSKLFLCKYSYIYGLKTTLLNKYVKVNRLIFYVIIM